MRLKRILEGALCRSPTLYALASRAYHAANGGFRTLSPGAPPSIRRAFELVCAAAQAERRGHHTFVGDYYEFGIFRGYTFLQAQRIADSLGLTDTRCFGFDSFRGLPPIAGADRVKDEERERQPSFVPIGEEFARAWFDGVDTPAPDHRGGRFDGRYFQGQFACSRQQVERALTSRGMDWARAELIEGFYSEALTEELYERLPGRPAAVVLFDCDLYTSTRDALMWMARLLRSGSVLLFDDWYSYGGTPHRGQPRAFHEFLATRQDLRAEPLWEFEHNGKAFVLRRAESRRRERGGGPLAPFRSVCQPL